MNIELILEGEFSGELASAKAKEARKNAIVRRVGTSGSTAVVQSMLDSCLHTPGVWEWGDNRTTVVDIRQK